MLTGSDVDFAGARKSAPSRKQTQHVEESNGEDKSCDGEGFSSLHHCLSAEELLQIVKPHVM